MRAIARFFLLKFWIFFKLLVKNTTNISCEQITPSHKCDKNQLCNTVTNTVKHTLSIIILLFVFTRLNTKNHHNCKNEKNFFLVKYVYYSPTIEL